jgi:hypothetical protein
MNDLVVNQWTSDGESGSYRDFPFRQDVWTMFRRQISEKISSTISTAWYFTTKSGGICNKLQPGPPAANTGKFTVRAVATIITLCPQPEQLSNSWKINGRIYAHCMGFLATFC